MSRMFSDSMGHAILAYIIKKQSSKFFGRTHIQKLPYILKAVGANIPFSYQLYLYGPYCQEVVFAVDDLLADEIISDTSTNPKFSNFRATEEADKLIDDYKDELGPLKAKIDKVVEIFSDLDPQRLELFTTLHYVYKELVATGATPTKEDIIKAFVDVKKDKFEADQIETFLGILKDIGLVNF